MTVGVDALWIGAVVTVGVDGALVLSGSAVRGCCLGRRGVELFGSARR